MVSWGIQVLHPHACAGMHGGLSLGPAMPNHLILQGLVYDELPFRADLRAMQALDWGFGVSAKFLAFKFQLSFSAEGYVDDPAWRSDAPPGIHVDDYKQRMGWIDKAALKYHQLMNGKCKQRMLAELRILAAYDE
jgi:Protein of unknown function (DUF2515)